MTTNTSRLGPPATRRGAGNEASAHLSRGESQAVIPPLILQLSGRISRRAGLLEASSMGPKAPRTWWPSPGSRLLLTRPPAAAPPFHTTGLWPVHSTDHRPESKDS